MGNHTPTLTSIDKKLAVLCERTENSIKIQEGYNDKLNDHISQADKRLRFLEGCQQSSEAKYDDHKSEINMLRNKSNVLDILLAAGTIIAGFLGINNK
jgi:hypothetical protein